MHEALLELSEDRSSHAGTSEDSEPPPAPEIVNEHEQAELVLRGGKYQVRIRRQLRNIGRRPVTQYLIRIAVDRYPGDPERSNQLYRHDPLTWEEISLSATCGDEPMAWRVKHDRDAPKEVWLLFENIDGKFPLYPGETTWISYQYTAEGCLSFFDVRGKVPRPLSIEVEHQDVDGAVRITTFERGMARLVCHEVDHLFGRLYRSRMRPGIEPISVSAYKGTGQQWTYQ